MSGTLDIVQQCERMAEVWPQFKLLARDGQAGEWVGEVRPLMQQFTISIVYRVPLAVELLDRRRMQPQVRVLAPQLRPRRGDREGQLPHVYYVGDEPLDVVLCLFDPDTDEWSPSMSLAETTVPWTIDWLVSYEGWRATGRWTGTGRHVAASSQRISP